VSSALEVREAHDGEEAADVEAVGRGVEAAVYGEGGLLKVVGEFGVGDLMNEAAPGEFFEQRHGGGPPYVCVVNKLGPTRCNARGGDTTREKGKSWRRHPDLNRGIKDLQSFALPLGHAANKRAVIL
jgi:hypothetical protein